MSDEQYLYLTTTGWKSGNPHEIEIWFVPHESNYYLMAEHREKAHWVQNIRHNEHITFRVGEMTTDGIGRVVDHAAEPDLVTAIAAKMDAKYSWSSGLIVELRPSED